MTTLNLGKVLNGAQEEGAHAWYQHLFDKVGIKIFQKKCDYNRAWREFIITKYLETSGLTTIAHGFSIVSLVSPISNKVLIRPAIIMEHIEGPKIQDVIDTVIYNHCPAEILTKNLSDKERWAYESDIFAPVRVQLERSITMIQESYGIKCCDHYENMNNIILQPNGLIRIIDFSAELIPKHLRKVINEQSSKIELFPNKIREEILKNLT